ncbi:MAG: electron transfer flavoprotein subunit beta/FixA family protein, partial [Pseudomonadota bacterium]|nr:electron transfer flavoprotein subunit beta/FixA family protein [Pseudomonadota bacterium]
QGMFASRLELKGHELIVHREVDSGEEILQLKLPAVVSTDLRLNQPRHVTLPNLMKAKQKPLEVQTLPDLAPSDYKILNVTEPAKRPKGVLLNSVDELLDKLKNEAKVVG